MHAGRWRQNGETRTAAADRTREGNGKETATQCADARLDDLSTYEKIAFYKLVSRKELEGIADGGRAGGPLG